LANFQEGKSLSCSFRERQSSPKLSAGVMVKGSIVSEKYDHEITKSRLSSLFIASKINLLCTKNLFTFSLDKLELINSSLLIDNYIFLKEKNSN